MENFLDTLKLTNKTYDFYFDIDDCSELKEIKADIKELNSLIGEKDFDIKLREILIDKPQLVKILPLLVAQRELTLDLLVEYTYNNPWIYNTYTFNIHDINYSVDNVVDFFIKLGLKDFIQSGEIEDVYSYMLGVHRGIRTHSRKNKSGIFMEKYIEAYLSKVCEENNIDYLCQATPKLIEEKFGITLSTPLNKRRYDFVIYKNNKLTFIESNFYSSSGSKIKAVVDEFIRLNTACESCSFIEEFVWITDGAGWKSERSSLKKAFNEIKNIINLEDMQNKWIENNILISI